MLIFQINPNQLQDGQEVCGKDWLFWNTYLAERTKEKDYVLLPPYIDFVIDTENIVDQGTYLVEVEDSDNNIDI